jgi:hypothetical protein
MPSFTAQIDLDEIVVGIALVIILAAAAFALGIFFKRLTDAERPSLLKSSGPIGFVHF